MTATCSGMAIAKHNNYFFVSETLVQDAVYTSSIQRIIEYEIILGLMAYTTMLITRSSGGALQSPEIDKPISVLGIQICDEKHISYDRRIFRHNIT